MRFETWRKFGLVTSALAVPAVAIVVIQPKGGTWSDLLVIVAYSFIFGTGALGAAVALFERRKAPVHVFRCRST